MERKTSSIKQISKYTPHLCRLAGKETERIDRPLRQHLFARRIVISCMVKPIVPKVHVETVYFMMASHKCPNDIYVI